MGAIGLPPGPQTVGRPTLDFGCRVGSNRSAAARRHSRDQVRCELNLERGSGRGRVSRELVVRHLWVLLVTVTGSG